MCVTQPVEIFPLEKKVFQFFICLLSVSLPERFTKRAVMGRSTSTGIKTDIVNAIKEHQQELRSAAYDRYKEYILSYVTKESMMKHTKSVIFHLDVSRDYLTDALGDVLSDLEAIYGFKTELQRVACGPHDLQRLTLTVD